LVKIEVTTLEMEALTAVQVALLTIYDMCKPITLIVKKPSKEG